MKAILFFILVTFGSSIVVNAQVGEFPNELKGYEFFGKGKLKTITFGVSNKKDFENLFGSTCENNCEYDDHFVIEVDYLSCDDCMTTTSSRDRAMCPLAEFMGTIEKITLKPKVPIRFDSVSMIPFTEHSGGSIVFKDGSEGVSFESFGDEFGLKYSIKQGTPSLILLKPAPEKINGPLYSITYGINVKLETRIFAAPYKDCIKK
jgi:hypothetical protein